MYCFQCQETAGNKGCTVQGVCGKKERTSNLQDLLIFVLKGIAVWDEKARELGIQDKETGRFIVRGLFTTITNANFDGELPEAATWYSDDRKTFEEKAKEVGVLSTKDEDVRSLRELLVIGLKGIAAYADHAEILGYEKDDIYSFASEALASTTKDLSVDEMV